MQKCQALSFVGGLNMTVTSYCNCPPHAGETPAVRVAYLWLTAARLLTFHSSNPRTCKSRDTLLCRALRTTCTGCAKRPRCPLPGRNQRLLFCLQGHARGS